jgi:hypothetical protein
VSKYTVEIHQIHKLSESMFPFEIKVFNARAAHLKTDYAMTKWGARRLARKIIRKYERGNFEPKIIDTYEVTT